MIYPLNLPAPSIIAHRSLTVNEMHFSTASMVIRHFLKTHDCADGDIPATMPYQYGIQLALLTWSPWSNGASVKFHIKAPNHRRELIRVACNTINALPRYSAGRLSA